MFTVTVISFFCLSLAFYGVQRKTFTSEESMVKGLMNTIICKQRTSKFPFHLYSQTMIWSDLTWPLSHLFSLAILNFSVLIKHNISFMHLESYFFSEMIYDFIYGEIGVWFSLTIENRLISLIFLRSVPQNSLA